MLVNVVKVEYRKRLGDRFKIIRDMRIEFLLFGVYFFLLVFVLLILYRVKGFCI